MRADLLQRSPSSGQRVNARPRAEEMVCRKGLSTILDSDRCLHPEVFPPATGERDAVSIIEREKNGGDRLDHYENANDSGG